MWFYELTGVFVGFDVADPIEELKLSLMRLWRYTGNFSGHTNSERRRRSQRAPRVWKRKRETFILRSAQLLRGTGDYRWIFHDRKDYALEFFALYLSDFFVHTACYTDQICYCSKYGNLIQSHICKGGENDKMSRWFLENQQKNEEKSVRWRFIVQGIFVAKSGSFYSWARCKNTPTLSFHHNYLMGLILCAYLADS